MHILETCKVIIRKSSVQKKVPSKHLEWAQPPVLENVLKKGFFPRMASPSQKGRVGRPDIVHSARHNTAQKLPKNWFKFARTKVVGKVHTQY